MSKRTTTKVIKHSRHNLNIIKQRCTVKSFQPGDFMLFETNGNECFGEYLGDGLAKVTSLTVYPDTTMTNRPSDWIDISLYATGPAFIKCEKPEWWTEDNLQ